MMIRYSSLEDLPVNVMCPKCKAENHLPDSLNRKTTYKCYACKAELNCGSNTNFRKVAVGMLIAWWLAPGLVWAARPMITSAEEYSFQAWIGQLSLCGGSFLPFPTAMATIFLLWEGFRPRKLTGVSPKGFRAFVYAS